MYLQLVFMVILIGAVLASFGDVKQGPTESEKQITKRHLIEAFTGNPKFHNVFSNPDQTLAQKFLGQQISVQTAPHVFYYAPPPLEEATPIEYDFFYDYTEQDDDDDDDSQAEYDGSDSSEEKDGTNFDDPIYAINPSLIYYMENCTGVDNGSLASDQENTNNSTATNVKPVEENDLDEIHINAIFNKTEYPNTTQNPEDTIKNETEEPKDDTTELNVTYENSYNESDQQVNNVTSQNDIFISHGSGEEIGSDKGNVSNNERNDLNKLATNIPSEGYNDYNFNKYHPDFSNQNSENSVLYTSTIHSNKHYENHPGPPTYPHEIVYKPPPTKVELTLERINNVLDRLQEKTHNFQKQVQHLSKNKSNQFHHDKLNSAGHKSNNGHLHGKDSVEEFLKNNFEHSNNTNNHNGENRPVFGKWFHRAKQALANVIINSIRHRRRHAKKLPPRSYDNTLPKYFPDSEKNVVVIPYKEQRKISLLPESFPNDEAVVVPANLQINDSPLGVLGREDVITLREFFNNDFEKRHYRPRRVRNSPSHVKN